MTSSFCAWVLAATLAAAASPAAAQEVMREDFDGAAPSCVISSLARNPTAARGPFGIEGQGVRIRYTGTDLGSGRTVFRCPLGSRGLEYTLSYDVRFDKDFQFVRGGKLHGLGPAHVMSGGQGTAEDGWSARVVFFKDGGVGTYAYNQDQGGRFGKVDRAADFRFETGRYYRIRLHVKLNSSAAAKDGEIRLWVDDRLLVERTDLRYRGVDGDKALIDSFLFSTFHGGGDPTWAPKDKEGKFTSVYADFDNFRVVAGPPDAGRSDQKQR